MQRWAGRAAELLPAVWLGVLLCVALIATPAGFALLPRSQAGAMAARILGHEAYLSLVLGVLVLLLNRWVVRVGADAAAKNVFTRGMQLTLGAIFCTLVGYFALLEPMAAAREGQGRFSFAQLHGISLVAYAVKVLLVAALAWRGAGGRPTWPSS